jgi:translation initiation factor 3 subunit C
MKINDWSAIQSLFDELNKRLERARKVADNVGTPRVYVRMLVELEDFLNGETDNIVFNNSKHTRTTTTCQHKTYF